MPSPVGYEAGAKRAQTPRLMVLADLELTLFWRWLAASAVWIGAVSWIALCFWLVLSSELEGFVLWALMPPRAAMLIGQVLFLILRGIHGHR